MPRLSPSDRKQALIAQQQAIADKLKALQIRERQDNRKADTRRKVIAGALALEHLDKNPDSPFAKTLTRLLDEYAKPDTRYLFPFLPETTPRPMAHPSPSVDADYERQSAA